MDFEAYLGSNYQLPTQVAGDIMHPTSSDILFRDGMLSPTVVASHMDSSFGYPSHSSGVLINSPYFEASMATNAIIAGYRSAPPVTDGSYWGSSSLNLPSSSLAANSLRGSSSLCLDHLLAPQQLSQAVQCQSEQRKRQQEQFSIISPMAQSMLQANHFTAPSMKFDYAAQVQKKPRLEFNKDDLLLQYMIQQLLLSESSKQYTSNDLKLAASHREYQVLNAMQKETTPSRPKPVEAHCQQLATQRPLTNCQKRGPEHHVSQTPVINGSTCAARVMQYLQHQRDRPKQNSIAYWRKFVAEYFASDARKRCCFSNYDHVGQGAFSQAVLDNWNCDICGTKSGRGFEVTYEVLPRLFQVNLEGGMIDELLYIDFPCESKLSSGCMMLQYTKAVQETVYKHSRAIHEGQLRVTFTKELKIMLWEFCVRHHEEFVPRRLIAPQVNQLIQAAKNYQDNIEPNKSNGGRRYDLQATNNRFLKAGGQLAKTLDSQIVSDCGFSKQLVRFLQIGDVFNCMKDLMTYSLENNLSPIESLNRYAQETKSKRKQMDERATHTHHNAQSFCSTGNKLMLTSSVPVQNPFDESIVPNAGVEANEGREAWSSTAEKSYYQKLLMDNAKSNGISSKNCSSNVQASGNPLDSTTWTSCQKLLSGNSMNSCTSMMVKPGPSWYEAAPSSASKSITQPASSNANLSTISFTQGDQDTRKYVLQKLLMEKVFNSRATQGPQPPTPQFPLTSGVKGRNEAMPRASGGSQRKCVTNRAPTKEPKSSSTRTQSSSMINRGKSPLTFKGPIKTEADVPEEHRMPLLRGVKVKKEGFHS